MLRSTIATGQRAFLLVLLCLGGMAACSLPKTSPYLPAGERSRDPHRAEELNRQGAALVKTDQKIAEGFFRQALAADLYCGPAHNNFGVLYLERGALYEAAHEFEWARKLMPDHPDPRLNLGLTLERALRHEEALDAYAGALEVRPEHLPSMEALVRLQLRRRCTDERTIPFLKEIAFRSTEAEWRKWAENELSKRDP